MAMTTCKECKKPVAAAAPPCPACGVSTPGEGGAERDADAQAVKQKAQKDVNRGCGAAVLVFLLIVGGCAYAASNDEDARGGGGNSGAALVACKRAVTQQLANPATADFETLATSIDETSAGFTISGPVKAKTGFGVEQELRYRCTTTKSGTVLTATVR